VPSSNIFGQSIDPMEPLIWTALHKCTYIKIHSLRIEWGMS
jgi:hypothetical protein